MGRIRRLWARDEDFTQSREQNQFLYDRDSALEFIRTLAAIHGIKPDDILSPDRYEGSGESLLWYDDPPQEED